MGELKCNICDKEMRYSGLGIYVCEDCGTILRVQWIKEGKLKIDNLELEAKEKRLEDLELNEEENEWTKGDL